QNGLPTQRYTSQNLPIRPGDVVIFDDGFRGGTGHIGLVASYTPPMLTTIEGNVDGGQIKTYTYDLSDPKVAAQIDGFGRPALSDFDVPAQPRGRVIQPS
ncbi:MAG TPA: CHAP domain-containing protein, partial [Myxococcales bacterium]|nr:CHAP domain-containing protein [Myxococcales bacterium]